MGAIIHSGNGLATFDEQSLLIEKFANPASLYLPSRTKLWCTPQLRELVQSPYFYSSPIHTLGDLQALQYGIVLRQNPKSLMGDEVDSGIGLRSTLA
jgi:hypothetical protein